MKAFFAGFAARTIAFLSLVDAIHSHERVSYLTVIAAFAWQGANFFEHLDNQPKADAPRN